MPWLDFYIGLGMTSKGTAVPSAGTDGASSDLQIGSDDSDPWYETERQSSLR